MMIDDVAKSSEEENKYEKIQENPNNFDSTKNQLKYYP